MPRVTELQVNGTRRRIGADFERSLLTPADQWKVAGQSEKKVNGREIVTGRHQYTSDIKHPGMLTGKIVRPPAFGSTLVSADTKQAEAMPGVAVVPTFAEVAIDRASGKVQIVRVVASFECGTVINPDQLKNQIEGSIVMGMGGALFEEIHFENGKILNPKLSKYRVPRFSDLPSVEVVLIDRKDIPAAGAGEAPIVGIAPAVGNAIAAATGIRLRSLPMVPAGLKV